MGKFKFLKKKVILNKKIKIYSKKNSKKLYCKLKTRNKTEMVTIKNYKKMKGGAKKNNPPSPSNSRVELARRKNLIHKSESKHHHPKNASGRINPFLVHVVDTKKFALNKDNFEVSKKDITQTPKPYPLYPKPYPLYPKPYALYTAGFPLHRRRHYRIPHRGPAQQQKRKRREVARQQFLDNEIQRAREERINLNLGIKNKTIRVPYSIERERRNIKIKNRGY